MKKLHEQDGKEILFPSWDKILIVEDLPTVKYGNLLANSSIILTNGESYFTQETKKEIEKLSGRKF